MSGMLVIASLLASQLEAASSSCDQTPRTLPAAAVYWQAGRMHAYSGTHRGWPRTAIAGGASGKRRARLGILCQSASEL